MKHPELARYLDQLVSETSQPPGEVMRLAVADNLEAPICSYQDLVTLKLQASRRKDLDDLEKLKQARGEQ